ncbi:uncharacterized protein LOC128861661 [Anastrepha ludens]|uniref:uncharacterized protein LOC128861661 n=1 Tax=Anastrepha ludens TaxID=28586 RepID=UPI0023AF4F14|nr:uncharacterized protein LOC128861661 [Anastrepha ludens]
MKMFYTGLVGLLVISKVHLISTEVRTFSHFNLSVVSTSYARVAQRVCHIAAEVDARVNLVYTCEPQDSTMHHLEHQLLDCMRQLPIYSLQLEQLDLELTRDYGSLSVFLLGELNSTASLTHLQRVLNAKQPRKDLHKYILIWRNAQLAELHSVFRVFWRKRILNVIAITSTAEIYTFEPFTPEGFVVKQLKHQINFYDKLKNLHHYQLRISMFKDFIRAIPKQPPQAGYAGVDGLMASSLVTHLNATVEYVTPVDNENYGACLANGSYTGVLRDLLADATHANFNAQFVLPCVAEHIETLYPHVKRILYAVVPAAEMFPAYLIFVYAYEDALWRALLVFFILIVVAFAVLKYCIESLRNVEKMKNGSLYDLIELFWKTQLGLPVDYFSNTNCLRMFFMAWLLFNYIMTTIYQAKVESIFVHPSYYPEMDRLDDLVNLNVPIFGVENIFTAVKPALKPHHWHAIEQRAAYLPAHFSSFQFGVPISEKINGRVAFLLRAETAKDLLVKTYDVEQHLPRFHVVKERLLSMPQTYLVAKGSPFRYKFQEFESRAFESGLFDYWALRRLHGDNERSPSLEEFRDELPEDLDFDTKESDDFSGANEVKKKVVLNLNILQGPFYIWGFGLLFSVFGFMLEYAYWWYSRTPVIVV